MANAFLSWASICSSFDVEGAESQVCFATSPDKNKKTNQYSILII